MSYGKITSPDVDESMTPTKPKQCSIPKGAPTIKKSKLSIPSTGLRRERSVTIKSAYFPVAMRLFKRQLETKMTLIGEYRKELENNSKPTVTEEETTQAEETEIVDSDQIVPKDVKLGSKCGYREKDEEEIEYDQ